MGTKAQILAGEEACVNNAHTNEPLFVLRSTDELSVALVRDWARQYYAAKVADRQPPRSASSGELMEFGLEQQRRVAKYEEAMRHAAAMEAYGHTFRLDEHLPVEERIARAEAAAQQARDAWVPAK